MTPLQYAKLGGILFACLLLSGSGFYFGGLRSAANLSAYKTAVETQHATQLQAVVKVLEDNAKAAAADHAQQQKVIDHYDAIKDLPDPASIGTAHRVLLLAAGAGASDCPVQEGGGVASGGARPAGGTSETRKAQSGLVQVLEADLDDYIAACGRDDNRLVLAQGLAPKPNPKPAH